MSTKRWAVSHASGFLTEMDKLRLDKFLSSQNICSRKDAGKLVREKRVTVNGNAAPKSDIKIDPERDIIEVDGKTVAYMEHIYIMMNKPKGVLSASNDKNAPTVIDLLPETLKRRGLFPAGRLDKDTTGLLIITDDGDFAHKMLAPKSGVFKLYKAQLDKDLTDEGKASLEKGITLADGTAFRPAVVSFENEGDRSSVFIKITEGKFHEVKRMFAYCGCEVLELERKCIGELALDGQLSVGEARLISERELKMIFCSHNS